MSIDPRRLTRGSGSSWLAEQLRGTSVIAAVRREADLDTAISQPGRVVFLLYGDINTAPGVVERLKERGKAVFLHLDLMGGFGGDRSALRFIARHLAPHGVLSTRTNLLKHAAEEGLLTIQRVFLLDSTALQTAITVARSASPTAIEAMPGTLPQWVIRTLREELKIPLILGGLLTNRTDIERAIAAGAHATSVSRPELWG